MNVLEFFNKYLGPCVKLGLRRCEMCGTLRIRLVEVGLYWVCDKTECIQKADTEVGMDIDRFLNQVEKEND
jgi:hypothetical protein